MRLDSLNSLHSLNSIIKKILTDNEKLEEVDDDSKIRNISENRYGKYYGIKIVGTEKKIWPWIGVYFVEDMVGIYVEINKEWCEGAFNIIESKQEKQEGNYFYPPYPDDLYRLAYCFELKEERFRELNTLESVEEQEALLKRYIEEVLDFLEENK
jgi:hypothetical protein